MSKYIRKYKARHNEESGALTADDVAADNLQHFSPRKRHTFNYQPTKPARVKNRRNARAKYF